MYRVKTFFLLFPSLLLFTLSACSERETTVAPTDEGVEVVFSAKQSTVTREEGDNPLLPSILIFRKKSDKLFSYSGDEESTNWEDGGKGVYLKSILLPTGNYRFLLAGGFTNKEETDEGRIFFSSTDDPSTSKTYDKDYFFSYSSAENTKDGLPKLKTCRTDLFVDANEKGFEANDCEYALATENKMAVKRKITRLQARLDLLVRRAEKKDGKIVPIDEGINNVDAMTNALKKIDNIQIQVDGVSSRCHVDGLIFSTPGSYSFFLKGADTKGTKIEDAEYKFEEFKFESFEKDFNVNVLDDDKKNYYRQFEYSAYCKGPLLFPAPDKEEKGDGETVGITVEINYKGILPENTVRKDLSLKRNEVSFLVIWLVNEEVKVTIEVGEENLEYSDAAEGDDGFWN